MRLDRYEDPEGFPTAPRYKVQRRQEDGSYVDVDPEECFVLKKKDAIAPMALWAYSGHAQVSGDPELAADVGRLAQDWQQASDRKMPD